MDEFVSGGDQRPFSLFIEAIQDDLLVLEPRDFRDLEDHSPPGRKAAEVNDEVDAGRDVSPHRRERQTGAAGHDHRLEPAEHVFTGVGVTGGERAVVAGIHGTEHVECLFSPDFADDDAFRPHAQRRPDEVPDGDLSAARCIGIAGLQPHQIVDPGQLQVHYFSMYIVQSNLHS